MKKYIMPSVKVMKIENHELLCASLPIDTTEVVNGGWTREMGGWSSENWSDVEEMDEEF